MSRFMKTRPSDGKPLPNALRDDAAAPEWIDEPTVPDFTTDDLDEELALVSGAAGQGEWPTAVRKGPL